jgi:Flp pilus assembly protein TadG
MVECDEGATMAGHYKQLRRSARGSVAVEMALILPLFLILLAGPLYIARAAWFYSVGQKAAHDATRYIATATQAEIRTQQELGEIVTFSDGILITIQCDGDNCGLLAPVRVRTAVRIGLHDNLLGGLTMDYLGSAGMTMNSEVTMRYVAQ